MLHAVRDVEPLPGYQDPYGLLCAILQDATNDWRLELCDEQTPAECVAWRVAPNGQSIGSVMLHLIAVEVFWFEEFALGKEWDKEERQMLLWDETDVDKGIWPDPPHEPLQWYFDLHDRIRTRTLESIKTWPSANSTIERWGRQTSLRWVLGHVIQHESYHGGQIVLLHDLWKRSQLG